MIRTYGGESNTVSFLLFASALGLIGIVLILFFAVMPGFFVGSKVERLASRAGSTAGVLAGISCMGIAVTPWDLYYDIHLVFVYSFSITFLLVVILYPIAIVKNKSYPNSYAAVFGLYVIVLSVYLGLLSWGPDVETREGLLVLATGQKVTVYSGMICLFIQFLGAFMHHRRHTRRHVA